MQPRSIKCAFRDIAGCHATNAHHLLIGTAAFHTSGQASNAFLLVFPSATEYTALGAAAAVIPAEPRCKVWIKADGDEPALARSGRDGEPLEPGIPPAQLPDGMSDRSASSTHLQPCVLRLEKRRASYSGSRCLIPRSLSR